MSPPRVPPPTVTVSSVCSFQASATRRPSPQDPARCGGMARGRQAYSDRVHRDRVAWSCCWLLPLLRAEPRLFSVMATPLKIRDKLAERIQQFVVGCGYLSTYGRAGREAPRDDARPATRRRSRVGGYRADVGQGRFAVFFDGQITERENADRTAVLHNGQSANG